ncbi:MAG TPA: hypothetical protein VMM60_07020 [Ilumatobacter sp.]|nr:hypothetical protein [Ilumatobacter sp.]
MTRVVWAVARTPRLWPTAFRVARAAAPRRWWRTRPFLPLPSRPYLAFRLTTQYGDPDAVPGAADVVAYLDWCREWHRANRAAP